MFGTAVERVDEQKQAPGHGDRATGVKALAAGIASVGGHYATSLLPALLLAGLGGGMSAPAVQIGGLSGVAPALTGVASGLLETMREIGGAIAIAVVSTVLISRAGGAGGVAHAASSVNAFHAAYWVIFTVAALGAITAAIAFQRHARQAPEPALAHGPAVHEPAAEPG